MEHKILAGSLALLCLAVVAEGDRQEGSAKTEGAAEFKEATALIAKLASDDFDTRGEAQRVLIAIGMPVRPLLLEHLRKAKANHSDPELRNGLSQALGAINRDEWHRRIEEWLKSAEVCLAKLEKETWQSEADLNEKIVHVQEKYCRLEEELKRTVEAGIAKRSAGVQKSLIDETSMDLWELKSALTKLKDAYCAEHSKLTNLVAQLKVAVTPDFLPPIPDGIPAEWNARALPFEQRLHLPVSFEFSDKPLNDVAAALTQLTGVKIAIASNVRNPATITLRVAQMQARIALEWVCRLDELTFGIDGDKQRVVICPDTRQEQ
jgi:hypothetical protein